MTVAMLDGLNVDVPAIRAAIGTRYPGAAVNSYVNGQWAWSHGQEAEFARKIRTSVVSGQPQAAKVARTLDKERFAAGDDDVWPFLDAREAAGHGDGTIYCSLSGVATVPRVLEVPRWWLAWYWQRPTAPTIAQVLAELKRLTGVDLAPGRLWACQWRPGQSYDVSVVYGAQDFSR